MAKKKPKEFDDETAAQPILDAAEEAIDSLDSNNAILVLQMAVNDFECQIEALKCPESGSDDGSLDDE